ncbi:hypothetical protein DL93DRAFT_1321685 [Clavulina sp. PMI_390]|nr:hypothetical protein DL93DRAFT_1321685 [Clavulina sp. PMI_390]
MCMYDCSPEQVVVSQSKSTFPRADENTCYQDILYTIRQVLQSQFLVLGLYKCEQQNQNLLLAVSPWFNCMENWLVQTDILMLTPCKVQRKTGIAWPSHQHRLVFPYLVLGAMVAQLSLQKLLLCVFPFHNLVACTKMYDYCTHGFVEHE